MFSIGNYKFGIAILKTKENERIFRISIFPIALIIQNFEGVLIEAKIVVAKSFSIGIYIGN
tara:strand:+ start:79 stop:261 length:183 start_codon:yes stop_codon:yes gene_type:complete